MRACYHCGSRVDERAPVYRDSECAHCHRDLRVCRNCTFYAPGSHGDCRETVPELVADKERANFCDYFRFRDSRAPSGEVGSDRQAQARKKLDGLFGG